ncbi:DUF4251 domain-containing protein [uncultured Bacteroides sp.]|uniref:DUF4251 domain-containing protein n=1 Tax=uncultured Bacteroides sp. TaxID=162156 RepID=UPI0026109DE4|nr:DUF4251 domain-containing protein [uncultured Bacteroides sp.]
MKKIVSLMMLLLLFVAGQCYAQSKSELAKEKREAREEQRKKEREQREKLQEKQDSLNFVAALMAIEQKAFTLEADQVIFRNGQSAFVNSNTNFVSLDDDKAVVQVAFNVPSSGLNGLGGVTVNGTLTQYQIKRDNEGNVFVTMGVMGAAISAQIFISLPYGTNQATVDINPNFNSYTLTLQGTLLPIEQSDVFKGFSVF